ncbi:unnamed protein product [Cochlearia groenlandica]
MPPGSTKPRTLSFLPHMHICTRPKASISFGFIRSSIRDAIPTSYNSLVKSPVVRVPALSVPVEPAVDWPATEMHFLESSFGPLFPFIHSFPRLKEGSVCWYQFLGIGMQRQLKTTALMTLQGRLLLLNARCLTHADWTPDFIHPWDCRRLKRKTVGAAPFPFSSTEVSVPKAGKGKNWSASSSGRAARLAAVASLVARAAQSGQTKDNPTQWHHILGRITTRGIEHKITTTATYRSTFHQGTQLREKRARDIQPRNRTQASRPLSLTRAKQRSNASKAGKISAEDWMENRGWEPKAPSTYIRTGTTMKTVPTG